MSTSDQPSNIAPIFVIGVGRSGTSLLQSMLASHSELTSQAETAFFRKFVTTSKLGKAYKKGGWSALKQTLNISTYVTDFDLSSSFLKNPANSDIDLEIYNSVQELMRIATGSSRTIDKDPKLTEFIPALHAAFSTAHIINIVRDPRDILVSKRAAQWSKGKSLSYYTFANLVQVRLSSKFGKKLYGARYIEILYEDLISNPKDELASICTFLGLEYDEKMLSFEAQAKKIITDRELSWKKETLGPLIANNSNKWENTLSNYDIALTETACSQAMAIGNYKHSNSIGSLSIFNKIRLYLSVAAIFAAAYVYIIIRVASQDRTR